MSTLDDLATQLAILLDRNNEDEFPTLVRRWCVNRAVDEIVRLERCPWGTFYTTVSWSAGVTSQALTAFDANAYRIDSMAYDVSTTSGGSDVDATVVELVRLSAEDRLAYAPDTYPAADSKRFPQGFAQIGDSIYVLPPPSEDMTLRVVGHKTLPELSDANTTNKITEEAPETVLWLAARRALVYFPGETGLEQQIFGEARKSINELVVRYARAQDSVRLRDELRP